jgi:SET domain-containing protein
MGSTTMPDGMMSMTDYGKCTPGEYDLAVKRASAGLGLFTEQAIPKGACIIEYRGRKLTAEEEMTSRSKYLFTVGPRKTIDGSERDNDARYINHSCRPNCEPVVQRGRVFIFAKRAIKPGEELVYHYGPDYFDRIIAPKGCRCAKCSPPMAAAKEP